MASSPADSQSQTTQVDNSWLNETRERAIRWALVAFFAVMATGYNLGPILEGPDELQHYDYIRYIVTTGSLPDRVTEYRPERWEYHQAPLYYLIGAVIRLPVVDDDYEEIYRRQRNHLFDRQPNVYGWTLVPSYGNFNKNLFLHTPAEAFPYSASGTALAVHLLRLYSTGLGLLTVITCAAIYRVLWPDNGIHRLAALGITCAWPQFQYQSGLVNNDNLATLTATICLYLCLRMLKDGAAWRTAAMIGATLGAAMLAKANGSLLIIPTAAAYVLSGRGHWRSVMLMVGIAAAVAGWWYVRNTIFYGDPSGLRAQYMLAPGLVPPGGHIPIEDLPAHWLGVYRTFWARFGAFTNIPLSGVEYSGYNLVTIVGAGGLALAAWRYWKTNKAIQPLAIGMKQIGVLITLAAAWIMGLTIFIYTNLLGGLGRLLLPCMAVWSAGMATGLLAWAPDRFRKTIAAGVMAIMAVLSVSALATFHAAYQPAPMPARIESARYLVFDKTVQLVGVSQDTITARPGETVEFSLYWRSLKSTDRRILIDIHTYSDVGGDLIDINSYPGTGNWPSMNWLPDQYWAERYGVEIPSTAQPGEPVPIVVYLFYPDERNLLPIIGSGNRPVMFPVVMQIRIEP